MPRQSRCRVCRDGAAKAAAGPRRGRSSASRPPQRPGVTMPTAVRPHETLSARFSWFPLARYVGPKRGDLIIVQDPAPGRHLAVLARFHGVEKSRLVVRKLAQVGRDRAGVEQPRTVTMRAMCRVACLALVDQRLIRNATRLRR